MSKKCSRIICMLLALVMAFGLMPAMQISASAETVQKNTYVGEVNGAKNYLVSEVEVEEIAEEASDEEILEEEFEVQPKTVKAIGTDKYGDTTFTTFADLKKLAAASYSDWATAYYAGSASEFVISESITIPENLNVYFWDIPVNIKSGVTVTNNGYFYTDKLTVNGTLVNNNSVHVSQSLTIKGQLKNAAYISLEAGMTLTGKDKITKTNDWAFISWNYFVGTEADVYKVMKAAANDKSGDQYSVYVDKAVTLKSNFTIPANAELYIWEKMTISGTCTVEGTLLADAPLTINGKLVNKGYLCAYNTTITFGSSASYSGDGRIHCYELAPEKAIKGLNLSQFDIQDRDYYYELTYGGNKTRLDKPTNLLVEETGYLGWTNGKNPGNYVAFTLYCNGEVVHTWREYDWGSENWVGGSWYTDTFRSGDWESGTYYFEAVACDETGKYRNSEVAKSATWTYKKPTAKLGTPTNVKLNGTTVTWTAPSNTTNLGKYRVTIYRFDSANAKTGREVGWSEVGKDQTSVDIEWALEYNAAGYYEVEVQAMTGNVNKILNSKVSARSNRAYLAPNMPPRLAGNNRHDTAIQIADQLKEVMGVNKFDAIIVAAGYDYADALAGSYLSAVKKAPILLSFGGGGKYAYLDDNNIAYIKANLKSGGTVYLLGGENAVPAFYQNNLSGFKVQRIGGANRFETNLLILEAAGVKAGQEILVCTSTNYADALAASATGLPILLVFNESGKLYGGQPDYLKSLGGKNSFCIIGGTGAVGTKIEKELKTYGNVTRLAGADRLATSVMIAEKYFPNAKSAVVAYGWNYPDGLCGGSLAYAMKAPLLLTYSAPKFYATTAAYTQKHNITDGVILGGEGLVSGEAVNAIF